MREEHRAHRERLLFKTPPGEFARVSGDTRQALADEYAAGSPERQAEIADLVADLAIDLGSYLTRWHLLAPHDGESLDKAVVREEVDRFHDLLRLWGSDAKHAEVDAEIASIERSNLRRLSEAADEGTLGSRWGHDAATGLTWAVRRGAVLVTTNPVMVNSVRKEDPTTWDPVRDALRASHPDLTPEQRVSLLTMSVVLEECRELRPVWEATGGRYGYVSLQVNPRANEDAGRMAEEVEDLHARLTAELGGTPNTVFKIPGTRAGIDAVRRVTARGIGVNITLNASIGQQLAFAEIIEQGSTRVSFLTLMMGRLDDPVRDELAAAGLPDAVEVSRWASVAVLRRAYPLLFEERGYRRSNILAASMRGPWTVDGAIVQGPSEVYISCFPDKAREYDSVAHEVASHVREPLPPGIAEKLSRSETFRRAYGVDTLPVEEFHTFAPVVQTLEQFSRHYDEFVDYNR